MQSQSKDSWFESQLVGTSLNLSFGWVRVSSVQFQFPSWPWYCSQNTVQITQCRVWIWKYLLSESSLWWIEFWFFFFFNLGKPLAHKMTTLSVHVNFSNVSGFHIFVPSGSCCSLSTGTCEELTQLQVSKGETCCLCYANKTTDHNPLTTVIDLGRATWLMRDQLGTPVKLPWKLQLSVRFFHNKINHLCAQTSLDLFFSLPMKEYLKIDTELCKYLSDEWKLQNR